MKEFKKIPLLLLPLFVLTLLGACGGGDDDDSGAFQYPVAVLAKWDIGTAKTPKENEAKELFTGAAESLPSDALERIDTPDIPGFPLAGSFFRAARQTVRSAARSAAHAAARETYTDTIDLFADYGGELEEFGISELKGKVTYSYTDSATSSDFRASGSGNIVCAYDYTKDTTWNPRSRAKLWARINLSASMSAKSDRNGESGSVSIKGSYAMAFVDEDGTGGKFILNINIWGSFKDNDEPTVNGTATLTVYDNNQAKLYVFDMKDDLLELAEEV